MIGSIGVAALGAIYYFGYRQGHNADKYDRLMFNLRDNLALHRLAVLGDTNRLETELRTLICAYSYYYDRDFSNAPVASPYVARDLEEARELVRQARSNAVLKKRYATNQ